MRKRKRKRIRKKLKKLVTLLKQRRLKRQSPKVQELGKGHQSLKNNPYAGKSSEDKKVKKESFDSYDIVINYLLEMGHVNSIDEANYVIMGMDKETLHKIVND